MGCLGGRCPFEVVTGLKPRMPSTVSNGFPVEHRTVNDYVKGLLTHLKEVHATVQRVAQDAIERDERTLEGSVSRELHVGDPVLVRREPTVERKGPTRFQGKTYPGIFVVAKKTSSTTYTVADLVDKSLVIPFKQPIHAERLIKLDMPELELRAGQPRRLEMREKETQPWNEYTVERFGMDGRVSLRLKDGEARWVDLSKCEYRWLQ